MPSRRKTSRSAVDPNALPVTSRALAWNQQRSPRKTNVVGNKQVKMSIAVIVHEGASGSPAGLFGPLGGLFGHISQLSIAIVSVKGGFVRLGALIHRLAPLFMLFHSHSTAYVLQSSAKH